MSDLLPRAVSREVVFRGKLFDVAVDEVEWPDGLRAKRETILHPGAVCMVPVDGEGRLLLVTQYRHAAGRRLLELPAGTLEPGEDPEPAAIRELQEEVGHVPAQVTPLGGFYVAPGYTTEYIHLFLCTALSPSTLDGDEDEDIEVERLTLEEALAAIDRGDICDGKSVVGVLRYARGAAR